MVFVFFAVPLGLLPVHAQIGMLAQRFGVLAPAHHLACTALIGIAVAAHSLRRDGSRNTNS
ncbi:MAG: hypothetical protein EPN49_05010 [Rhodanobacter sp.]|nr:MAG: hypothetical protein EPN49_05010 [Rhodanobacter sp.]